MYTTSEALPRPVRVWLHYLSLFKWMLDSMLINALGDGFGFTDTKSNYEILSEYSIQDTDRGVGIAVIATFTIVFRLIFYTRLVTAFTGSRKG